MELEGLEVANSGPGWSSEVFLFGVTCLQGDIFCNGSELFSIHPILTVNILPQSEMTARYLFSKEFNHI